jgi:ferredoxin
MPAATRNVHLKPVSSLTRLAPHARLWANAAACLPQRFADVACGSCVDECPTGVLTVTPEGFALATGCVDCGRCAAACPTGALSLSGFRLEVPTGPAHDISVECWKVPKTLLAENTVRVPCTGALKTSELLALVNAADGAAVAVVDRGWCTRCTAGGPAEHPVERRLAETNALLAEIGVAPQQRLVFKGQYLPPASMPDTIPDPGARRELGRRGFLRHLVGQAATTLAVEETPPVLGELAGADGNARILPAERLAVLAQLRLMAKHGSDRSPASLFHSVTISEACQGDHVCARSCPTAALSVFEDAGHTGVHFEPALCIGCAQCARTCPERAVTLTAAATGDTPPRARALTRARLLSCFDCGTAYTDPHPINPSHDAARCPACRKSGELARSLFSGLFSSRQATAQQVLPRTPE